MDTAAEKIAAFSTRLTYADIPSDVREAAKLHLLDAVGCALAAVGTAQSLPASEVSAAQGGAPEATGIGRIDRLPATSAAMVNGAAAHALDFDDTHEEAICHVSAVVGPVAIAAAEAAGASGKELLTAFVAGSETVSRLGMAAPGHFHARGFHPTSVCGIFGATVAASRLLGLDARRTASAMGLAGSFAAGIFAYLADGSPTKPIHAGWAAQAGIQAARLSAAGAAGPAAVLESRFGLYESHTGAVPDLGSQLADLGTRWETTRIAFKAYPACHFLHGCVDAAVAAFERAGGVDAAEITHLAVRVSQTGADLVLEPPSDKARPRTPYDAKFSLPFSVASRLVHGRLDVRSYSEDALAEPAVLDLAERISHSTWTNSDSPAAFAGEAVVELTDGRSDRELVVHPLGSPSHPMDDEDVMRKFHTNASTALHDRAVQRVGDALQRLDQSTDVSALVAPLVDAAPERGAAAGTRSEGGPDSR